MDPESTSILQRLVNQWEEVNIALSRMNSAATVRPYGGWAVFRPPTSAPRDNITFDFGPAVFNLPERASHVDADLFVVVSGQIAFRRGLYKDQKLLATDSFSTRAAYFRLKGNGADHIYGAHYDFSLDELGHPVFHAQMRSFVDMWESVIEQYNIDVAPADKVLGILQTVRLPTAQMDIFSFFLQLCADHLLFSKSGKEEREAFNTLLTTSSSIRGAAFQTERLSTEDARSCYRARHWYPTLP
jgi:hypothetical protein